MCPSPSEADYEVSQPFRSRLRGVPAFQKQTTRCPSHSEADYEVSQPFRSRIRGVPAIQKQTTRCPSHSEADYEVSQPFRSRLRGVPALQAMAVQLPYETMNDMLQHWSCRHGDRAAFIFRSDRQGAQRLELTRAELYDLGGRWAAVLHGDGVGPGQLVVNTLPNCPERVLCDAGIALAGAVSVNAQCQLADGSDLLHTLRQSRACAVCVNPDLAWGPWSVLKEHVQHDPVNNTITASPDSLPALRKVYFIRRTSPLSPAPIAGTEDDKAGTRQLSRSKEEEDVRKDDVGFHCPKVQDFIKGLRAAADTFYTTEVTPDDLVTVFTTSGSTGFSKLVPITHASFVKCSALGARGSLDDFGTVFSLSPLGWVGGYVFIYLMLGKACVLFDCWHGPPDSPAALAWDVIREEGCYNGGLMTYMLPKILEQKDSRKTWKMRSLMVAGQPIKRDTVSQALLLSEVVVVSYTSTELITVTCAPVTDASSYEDYNVGVPCPALPCNTVKICDGRGQEVARGTKGEVYAKTAYMAREYLNNQEDTKASFLSDGFFRTGDIGWMKEDGTLVVEGRHPDIIHRGNYIFYPSWLEGRIMKCCPGLHDVMVVGVFDQDMGQEICACFVPSDPSMTEERVRSYVERDVMAKTEDPLSPRPRYYLRFPSFPTTFTFKPLRKDVRLQAAHKLNLN